MTFTRGAVTACLALGLAATAGAQRRDDYPVRDEATIVRQLRFAGGPGRILDVRAITGSIEVSGASGDEIELEIRRTIRAASEADRQTAERDVSIDFIDNAARVEARVVDPSGTVCGEPSDGRWQRRRYQVRFDFSIRVPRGAALRLCTITGGDILVMGTSGDFDIDNVNGRVIMADVRGSGSVRTVNGPVTVSFAESPTAPSLFETINGDVDVSFPEPFSADLRLKTFNGGLYTDFDVQPLPRPASGSGQRRNGQFVYRSNDYALVRAGRGGPELTFETLNGDVRVRRAAP